MAPNNTYKFLSVELELKSSYLLTESGRAKKALKILAEAAEKYGLDVLCMSGYNSDDLKRRVKELNAVEDKIEYVWVREEPSDDYKIANSTSQAFTFIDDFLEAKKGIVYVEPFKLIKLENESSAYSFLSRFVDAISTSDSVFLVFISPSAKLKDFQEEVDALVSEGTINLDLEVAEKQIVPPTPVPEAKEVKKVKPKVTKQIVEEKPKKVAEPSKDGEIEFTILITKWILDELKDEHIEDAKKKIKKWDWRVDEAVEKNAPYQAKAMLKSKVEAIKTTVEDTLDGTCKFETGYSEDVDKIQPPIKMTIKIKAEKKDFLKASIALIFNENKAQLKQIKIQ